MSEEEQNRDRDDTHDEAAGATLDDWKLLDVMPGVPERVLRTAYARKLKVTKPEVDPEGFQKLRAAYERALASLADEPRPKDEAAQPQAPSSDHYLALAELMQRFESRRRRADTEGALAAVDEALAGTFRAPWRNAVEDALFDSVAGDPSTRLALVRELARRFDWHEATGRQATRSGERMNLVRELVEAADLVDGYRARAAAARAGTGPAADRILSTILGPYRVGLFDRALGEDERDVAATFMNDAYQRLAGVDGFVDARMLAAVRAALGATPLAAPPPAAQAAAPSAAATSEAAPAAAPARGLRFEWRYIYFALFAVLVLSRVVHGGLSGMGTSPDAPTYSSPYGRADIPGSLSASFDADGTGHLDLRPLLDEKFSDKIQALRVRFGADGEPRDIPIAKVRETSGITLPPYVDRMWLRLVFDDGALGPNRGFNLNRPPAQPDKPKGTEL